MMISPPLAYIEKFSEVFEPALLTELETKSMLMEIKGGDTMLNIGQLIRRTRQLGRQDRRHQSDCTFGFCCWP